MKKFGYSFVKILCGAVALSFCASCQHDIDPDALDFPPEIDESGFVSNTISQEEAEKELKKIAETPYPPYTVQGGDVFRIKVYNEEELDNQHSSSTMITPDGYLIVGLIDPVMVKDLTIVEATNKVSQAMGKYVKYPKISLIPQTIQGKSATLFGAVREPGNYYVNDNTRLADFVAQGKGFARGILDNTTVDLADISTSYVVRNDKILPINFTEALVKGNQLHNIKIFPQDIVYIAKREDSRVMIMGQVNDPRAINWSNNMTITELIAHGGGLKEDYWNTALVLRKPRDASGGALKVYKVNLHDLLSGRGRNFRLASGDIVYVPRDSLGEYNTFIHQLLPTAQLINALMSPPAFWFAPRK